MLDFHSGIHMMYILPSVYSYHYLFVKMIITLVICQTLLLRTLGFLHKRNLQIEYKPAMHFPMIWSPYWLLWRWMLGVLFIQRYIYIYIYIYICHAKIIHFHDSGNCSYAEFIWRKSLHQIYPWSCTLLHGIQHYVFECELSLLIRHWLIKIHCGLVTPYGDKDLGQHWLK